MEVVLYALNLLLGQICNIFNLYIVNKLLFFVGTLGSENTYIYACFVVFN